jgi:pimeloyl-ACP methyl ester carboxylesterase
MRITRHFLTVGNRRVHYTRAGEGPAVCLLHASPCSAKVLSLPQKVFAGHFTALAFDTPGFGLSDLLPLEQPEIEDFADGLAEPLRQHRQPDHHARQQHIGAPAGAVDPLAGTKDHQQEPEGHHHRVA